MSIWHTPVERLKGGDRTGKFSVCPRRDKIAADGSMVKTNGFQITIPRNGILDTEKLNPLELQQANLCFGDEWPAKLDEHLKINHRLYGLEPGMPTASRPQKVEKPQEVEEGTVSLVTKIQQGRSVTSK